MQYDYGKFIATALPLIGAGVNGLDRLAEATGMHRSTVHRLQRQLLADGLVIRATDAEGRTVRNTLRLSETGQQMTSHIRLARVAKNGTLHAAQSNRS